MGTGITDSNTTDTNDNTVVVIADTVDPTRKVTVSAANELETADKLKSGGVNANLVVGTAAVEVKVGASKLANRKCVTVYAVDSNLYWGYSSGVTIANGTLIFKGQFIQWDASDTCQIWLISSTAAKNARITESP